MEEVHLYGCMNFSRNNQKGSISERHPIMRQHANRKEHKQLLTEIEKRWQQVCNLTQYCPKLPHEFLHSLCGCSFSASRFLLLLFNTWNMSFLIFILYNRAAFTTIWLLLFQRQIELFYLIHILLKLQA